MRPWLALVLFAIAGCEGTTDIPDSQIVCCRNGDRLTLIARLDCVFDPAGRVVEYYRCDDGGTPEADAGE